jgi:hypothetical protein
VDGLIAGRATLEAELARVAVPLRDRRPREGRWSIGQILEHLVIVESGVTRLLAKLIPTAPARPGEEAFDADVFRREMAMPFVVDRMQRLQSPERTWPGGRMNAATAWVSLLETRRALLDLVRTADGHALERVSFPHALLGPFDLYQWIAFVGLHEARHAAQIREVSEQMVESAPSSGGGPDQRPPERSIPDPQHRHPARTHIDPSTST